MFSIGQTIVNKETGALVRVALHKERDAFAWSRRFTNVNEILLVDEKGRKFIDDISKYDAIRDEFGQLKYGNYFHPNDGPDISLRKYLISEEKMKILREKGLKECEKLSLRFEKAIHKQMDSTKAIKIDLKNEIRYNESTATISVYALNVDTRLVSRYFNFYNWFIKRHKGKLLYTFQTLSKNGKTTSFAPGAYKISYHGKNWIYDTREGGTFKLSSI